MSDIDSCGYINVARIVTTFGRQGEVIVACLDDLTFCLREHMRVCLTPPQLGLDRYHVIEHIRSTVSSEHEIHYVKFREVNGLSEAQRLVGNLILAKRADVDIYVREKALLDCIGRDMVDVENGYIGQIIDFIHTPYQDSWVVRSSQADFMVPVVDEFVCDVPEQACEPVVVKLPRGLGGK